MARQKVSIQSVSDIITAQSGRQYFTLENTEQKKFVCFITSLHEHCKGEIDAEVTEREHETTRLDNIYVDGKPVSEVKPKTGRSFGRDEVKVDERTAIMEVGADVRAKLIDVDSPLNKARLDWLKSKLIKGGKDETKTSQKTESSKEISHNESHPEDRQDVMERPEVAQLKWFTESIKTLHEHDPKTWAYSNVSKDLKNAFSVEGATITEQLGKLSASQLQLYKPGIEQALKKL